MLLVNANQEVIGFFKTKKEMPELQEGDTIIKTKKAATEANLGDHWPKPAKVEKDPDAPKVERTPVPTEGSYKVKEGFVPKSKEGNEGRKASFEALMSCSTIEEYLATAQPYEFNGKKISLKGEIGYCLRKGIITLV